jgi:hypothetical protein
MHRSIEKHHPAIARTMRHVDHSAVELERLQAEQRTAVRRWALEAPAESSGANLSAAIGDVEEWRPQLTVSVPPDEEAGDRS